MLSLLPIQSPLAISSRAEAKIPQRSCQFSKLRVLPHRSKAFPPASEMVTGCSFPVTTDDVQLKESKPASFTPRMSIGHQDVGCRISCSVPQPGRNHGRQRRISITRAEPMLPTLDGTNSGRCRCPSIGWPSASHCYELARTVVSSPGKRGKAVAARQGPSL